MQPITTKIADKAPIVCPVCGGTGWKISDNTTDRRAARCDCMLKTRGQKLLANAAIPPRYEHCEFANYRADDGRSLLAQAKASVIRFVESYPVEKTGLILLGSIGVGKTHLAVAAMRQLILGKGIPCLFCDYRELLKQIQNSYNSSSEVTELQVLAPVFETEVLVLDELGAVKPSEWVWDTVSLILNSRYNNSRTTIITTNLLDEPAGGAPGTRLGSRAVTLGDRIGERMRSRLHEMCRVIRVDGEDYRQQFRRVNAR
jgi:DNA replication protein DnaC